MSKAKCSFQVQEGEEMPEFIFAIIGAIIGIVLGFVIARYLVNSATKRKEEEAESIVEDAKRKADAEAVLAKDAGIAERL